MIVGSPTPPTWMTYYISLACPGKGALNRSSTLRPTILTSWELERGMGLLSCGLGLGVGVKRQKGENRAPSVEWYGGEGDQSMQRPSL